MAFAERPGPPGVSRRAALPSGTLRRFTLRQVDAGAPGFEGEVRTAGTPGTEMIELRQAPIEMFDVVPGRTNFISALNDPAPVQVHAGDGWRRGLARRGVIHVLPADVEIGYRAPTLHLRLLGVPTAQLAHHLDEVGLASTALDPVIGRFKAVPQAAELVDTAWRAARGGGPAASLAVDGLFLAMLGLLLRAADRERIEEEPPAIGDARIARVVEYLEAHLDEPVRRAELAALAGVSTFHFGRVFHAATGRTPHAFLTDRRIARARRLLADPTMPLAQVAQTCGFATQSHFTRVFHAHVGSTPGAYRVAVTD